MKLKKTTFQKKLNPSNPTGFDASSTRTKVTIRKNLLGQTVTKVKKTTDENYNNPKTARTVKTGYKKINGVIKKKY